MHSSSTSFQSDKDKSEQRLLQRFDTYTATFFVKYEVKLVNHYECRSNDVNVEMTVRVSQSHCWIIFHTICKSNAKIISSFRRYGTRNFETDGVNRLDLLQ
ncbi:hypothetical protein CDAR_597481 [Caerostris darwini]|uniref:Uncharacterized protein n=1 Tax=Caerostris darwini TaxID=1538125 RepID=A0AAV4TY09_9ARAC|nr:hypothetical protein CDAR_597481 [Caerostris darwini]